MTRDYKPASRKTVPSSGSGSSLLVGILIGLLLGLGIALAVAIYLNRIPGPFLSRGKPAEQTPPAAKSIPEKPAPAAKTPDTPAKADEKRRFDFYEILPGTDTAKGKGTDTGRTSPSETKETVYLQAGAFHVLAEADNMKARLAPKIWLRQWQGAPEIDQFQLSFFEIRSRLLASAERLGRWTPGFISGAPVFDPVVFAYIWGMIFWYIGAWAAWSVHRWNNPLLGILPAGIILAGSLNLTGGDARYFELPLVGSALLLLAFTFYTWRERHWVRDRIDTLKISPLT